MLYSCNSIKKIFVIYKHLSQIKCEYMIAFRVLKLTKNICLLFEFEIYKKTIYCA